MRTRSIPWTQQKARKSERVPDYDKDQPLNVGSSEPTLDSEGLPPDPARATTTRNLDNVLVRGVAWTAAVKWLTQAVTWGITVLVARLLTPSDYGLVGMATIYIFLFTLFSEFGIGTAVVTLRDLTETKYLSSIRSPFAHGSLGFRHFHRCSNSPREILSCAESPSVVVVLSAGLLSLASARSPILSCKKNYALSFLQVSRACRASFKRWSPSSLPFWVLDIGPWFWAVLSSSVTTTWLMLIWRRQSFALPRFASIRTAIHYSRHIVLGRLCWAAYDNSDFIVAGGFWEKRRWVLTRLPGRWHKLLWKN